MGFPASFGLKRLMTNSSRVCHQLPLTLELRSLTTCPWWSGCATCYGTIYIKFKFFEAAGQDWLKIISFHEQETNL
jgi:hypothetical protein